MQLPTVNPHKQHWTVHDVILLSLIAIFFGLIYQGWNYVYYLLAATPLKPYANDLTLGVWLMAGPVSALLLKKRNACLINFRNVYFLKLGRCDDHLGTDSRTGLRMWICPYRISSF